LAEDEFHREFNTNVLGSILTIQEAVKQFGRTGGSIINISSIASVNPTANALIYAATKSALDSITRVLAQELGSRKIRVNTIASGGVETEGLHRIGIMGSAAEKQMVSNTPLGDWGSRRISRES
jgi:3-oxoacyl-[acyl-carrier protein] reductase